MLGTILTEDDSNSNDIGHGLRDEANRFTSIDIMLRAKSRRRVKSELGYWVPGPGRC